MIYIHIPFCRQKCSYCNFHFSTSLDAKDAMVSAIKKELYLRKYELADKTLKSLYFGGGTPSLLKVDALKSITDEVLKYFTFDPEIEITLEANPDDLNNEFLRGLSSSVFNRLSIGTQSFFDDDLKLMNRAHNASEAESSIKRSQDFGFENISIDLIYGSPTSDLLLWKETLKMAVELEVPHISAYALTVEPKTALKSWIDQKKVSAPKEAEQNEEFYYLSSYLRVNGFDHYEISNFGKPNFHSKHNSAYWQGKEYLGLGPSAHSYDGGRQRSWNIANNRRYIDAINAYQLPLETEILSEYDQLNEMLMIGLRTTKGVDVSLLKQNFKDETLELLQQEITVKINEGLLIVENDFLKIPQDYWFLADGIASDLFLVE